MHGVNGFQFTVDIHSAAGRATDPSSLPRTNSPTCHLTWHSSHCGSKYHHLKFTGPCSREEWYSDRTRRRRGGRRLCCGENRLKHAKVNRASQIYTHSRGGQSECCLPKHPGQELACCFIQRFYEYGKGISCNGRIRDLCLGGYLKRTSTYRRTN